MRPIWLLFGAEAFVGLGIALWLRQFRVDRTEERDLWYTFTENVRVLLPDSYNAEGRRYLPLLWLDAIAAVVTLAFLRPL